jgi:hypothetical protein
MPNQRYILRQISTAIAGIRRDVYYVDVATCQIPNYAPMSPAMMLPDTPSAHIWAMESGLGNSKNGAAERELAVWIYGVVKQNEEIQEALIDFAESVRAVMLFQIPISLPGDLAVTVIEGDEGIAYQTEKMDGGGFAGTFVSKWRVNYAFPSPAG